MWRIIAALLLKADWIIATCFLCGGTIALLPRCGTRLTRRRYRNPSRLRKVIRRPAKRHRLTSREAGLTQRRRVKKPGTDKTARKVSAADKTLLKADRLTGTQFEQWCAKLLRKGGYWFVRVVGKSNDQGADILAWKHWRKYVIQCKCYSGKVGNAAVQQANAAVEIYGNQFRDRAVVMTNSYFTKGAKEAAQKCNVLLWDRDTLRKMLKG